MSICLLKEGSIWICRDKEAILLWTEGGNWPNSVKRRFSDGSWAESSLLSKQQLQGHTGDGVGDDNLEWVTRRKKKKGGKKKWKRAVGQDG